VARGGLEKKLEGTEVSHKINGVQQEGAGQTLNPNAPPTTPSLASVREQRIRQSPFISDVPWHTHIVSSDTLADLQKREQENANAGK
jgi:hypothetical protein